MICKKCNSSNVIIQMVGGKIKRVSIIRRLIRLMLIVSTCGLWLLLPSKKGKIKNVKMLICQDCGYSRKS